MTCPCFVCWPLFLQSRLWLWKQKYWGHWQGQFWGKQSSQVSLDQWLMGWFTMKSTLYFLSCVRKLSVYLWRRLTNQKAWERFHLTRERGDSFCCEFCFYCVPKNRIILTLKGGQRFCVCVCVCVCAYEDYRGNIYIQHKPSILWVVPYAYSHNYQHHHDIGHFIPQNFPLPFCSQYLHLPSAFIKGSAHGTVVFPFLKFHIDVIL